MTGDPAIRYRSTQTAYQFPVGMAALAVGAGIWAAAADDDRAAAVILWIVFAVVAIVGAIFSRLTVVVGKGQVLAQFGAGWPRRRFHLSTVTTARPVRNRWWHGWGLRWIPNGSMYNVWGLDAVELELESGTIFRIGTDQPDRLLAAIESERARLTASPADDG